MAYTNSPLVNYTLISPNRNSPRNGNIDRITIHMVVGQCTVEALGQVFLPESRQASSNYGIGYDGRVGMYCPECDRSWCSSSQQDHYAVTIECASDTYYPYKVNDTVYNKLIQLCADICKRNGKTRMVWLDSLEKVNSHKYADTDMKMTLHKWFAATACPGYYLESHMQDIANRVNKLLAADYPEVPFYAKVLIGDLNLRTGAGTNYQSKGYAPQGWNIVTKVKSGWGRITDGWIYLENPEYVKIGDHMEKSPFSDVKITDSNYAAIKACYDAGLIGGYSNGKFKPKAKLTRGQACTILYKLMKKLEVK